MSGGHDHAEHVDLATARRLITSMARVTDAETVAAEDAVGRITIEPVSARIASPHYRGSAMDGIAVSARATAGASSAAPLFLREVDADAGPFDAAQRIGSAVDTGNPLPAWADAVVRIEAVRRTRDGFEISEPVSPGRDVRSIGEDVEAGAPLLPRGHRIRPFDVGALLATGHTSVSVRRRPTVAVLATGAEIVEPGEPLRPGRIIEYNSRMLAGFVGQAGGEARYLGRLADDAGAIEAAVREAAAQHDLVCVIAGSSHGRKDFTLDALAACGIVRFRGVAMAPGRPTGLAVVGDTPVLAIPGYPVSAVIAYRELVGPLLAVMLGCAATPGERVGARVRREIALRLGVEEMLRVCLAADGKDLIVAPLPRGAGSVTTLVRADGILRIAADCSALEVGRDVEVELLRPREEIGRTIVVASGPCELLARLEDESRRAGHSVRFGYLGRSLSDAVDAMAACEAHCALFSIKESCGLPDAPALLSATVAGWRGHALRSESGQELLLAYTAGFAASALFEAARSWTVALERAAYRVTSTGSGGARS
jgi:putative molybdopterin biosynthesis protein